MEQHLHITFSAASKRSDPWESSINFYMKPTDENLKTAMDKYTAWLESEIEKIPADDYQNLYLYHNI